jgi:glucose/arabinose dehydrogenase
MPKHPALVLSLTTGIILSTAAAAQQRRVSIENLWADSCAKCHGDRGQGGGAGTRTLLIDDWRNPAMDRTYFDAIAKGLPEKGMEAFGETLEEEQMWGLVVYIREMQAKDFRQRGGSPKAEKGVYTSSHAKFRTEPVVKSGLSVPWSVEFLPAKPGTTATEPRLLITERPGGLRIFEDGKLSSPVADTPEVRNQGQGGLMDVTLHPDFASNGWIYLSFADPLVKEGNNLGITKVVRGRIKAEGDGYKWEDQETIFQARPEHYVGGDVHFGNKIVFAPAGEGKWHVFFGIGERGRQEMAQDLTRPNGKIHRLWDDGKIPEDNPFVAEKESTYKSIWSYGHRNPQGLTFDSEGNLWDTEHGPRGGDELNLIKKGANYGWPIVSYGMNYNGSAFRFPWVELDSGKKNTDIQMPADRWLPSIGACGLGVVKGEAFAAWKGDLLAGGLSGSNIDRLRVKDGKVVEHEELLHGIGRVRDVETGPDGLIYIVLNGPDRVIRMLPVKE